MEFNMVFILMLSCINITFSGSKRQGDDSPPPSTPKARRNKILIFGEDHHFINVRSHCTKLANANQILLIQEDSIHFKTLENKEPINFRYVHPTSLNIKCMEHPLYGALANAISSDRFLTRQELMKRKAPPVWISQHPNEIFEKFKQNPNVVLNWFSKGEWDEAASRILVDAAADPDSDWHLRLSMLRLKITWEIAQYLAEMDPMVPKNFISKWEDAIRGDSLIEFRQKISKIHTEDLCDLRSRKFAQLTKDILSKSANDKPVVLICGAKHADLLAEELIEFGPVTFQVNQNDKGPQLDVMNNFFAKLGLGPTEITSPLWNSASYGNPNEKQED